METRRASHASLRMAETAEVAGSWTLVAGDRRCALELTLTRVESANAYGMKGGACLDPLLRSRAVGWRPAPEGLEIVGADRLTLATFVDDGRGRGSADLAGTPAVLERRK